MSPTASSTPSAPVDPTTAESPSPTDTVDEAPGAASTSPDEVASSDVATPTVAPVAVGDEGGGRGWLVALLVLAVAAAIGGGALVLRHRRA